ncbi:MAG TPA: FAD-binding protein [Egicoccus sp.]|nr:FAD-binding protein [Egicoccus sp.]HSK25112.1 FAD-binding protein [Egicoccus sp.]
MSATSTIEPTTADDVAAALADLRAEARPVEISGGGSVLGRLPASDAPLLSVAGLRGIVAHAADDLTITVRAGTPLTELAAELADAGQECPIEPVGGLGSTVGGRIATALAGPRQLGAGRVRDWLLRARFVTGDGRQATAGGVTVKDVTGYDLCRLVTGSWGTIAVLTEVTLKLRPIPRHRAWYVTDRPRHDLDRVLFRPAGLFTGPDRTWALLEGHPDDAADQAALAGLVPADGAPDLPARARAALDPAALDEFVAEIAPLGLQWVAQDGVGVVHLDGGAPALASAREAAVRRGGSLLVLDPSLGLPAFGPGPGRGDDAMTERVRSALDPDGLLAPWRWTR